MTIINFDRFLCSNWIKMLPCYHHSRLDGKSDGCFYDITFKKFCMQHNLFKKYNKKAKHKMDLI